MISVNGWFVRQDHFPDGTLHLDLPIILKEQPIYIEWNYENDAELFTVICIREHYASNVAVLFLPYIPHARMDRVKEENDVFTLKYFCMVINSLNFSEVHVLDAHSNVSLALLMNVHCDNAKEEIEYAINKTIDQKGDNVSLFFPDEGAMKRYSSMFSNFDFAFGMKDRDWKTGKINSLKIINEENIVGKDVLIIDDICSRGGTFYYSAKALHAAGAKSVSLYITHCEETILKGEIFNSGLIEKVYTTSSLPHSEELRDKVEIVDLEEGFDF